VKNFVLAGAAYWDKAAQGARTQGLFRLDKASGEWNPVTNGLPDELEVRCITVRGTDTIYLGTQHGPYRSTDGGENWVQLTLPGAETVVWSILALGDKTLFVGAQNTTIYRSDDDGISFRQLEVPTPDGACVMAFPNRVIRMAADPANADEIYAALEVSGVVRSLDGGETWRDCSAGLIELAAQDRLKSQIGTQDSNEGMMDSHALLVSPSLPGTVFLANRMGLFCSPDKGESWKELGIGRFSDLTYARDLRVFPHDPNTLFAALSHTAAKGPGSLYRSQDLGESWTRFDHGLSIDSTLMTLATSAGTPERIYCAARKGQVFGTEDGGKTWREYPLPEFVQGVYALACG
jgi:photosystem II stability/assembly factor-like uncharacterized protein